MLNGSKSHGYYIKDFQVSAQNGWTWNGTATMCCDPWNGDAPISKVPISITPFPTDWPTAIKLWIDPTKVMNHFGNTPIFGVWWG